MKCCFARCAAILKQTFYIANRYFAESPHFAGSPRNNELADHIVQKWTEYGFDKVEKTRYDVLVSLPRDDAASKVQILTHQGKVEFESQTREKVSAHSQELFRIVLES